MVKNFSSGRGNVAVPARFGLPRFVFVLTTPLHDAHFQRNHVAAERAERSEASEAADFCDASFQRYHAERDVSNGSI